MLLDLLVRESEGRVTYMSTATIGSGSSSSTGLRYLAKLQENGLITIEDDFADRRRRRVELTRDGTDLLQITLSACLGAVGAPAGSDQAKRS
ncbi:hypothetical protein [Sphingomonas sp. Y38-1Y]|uniref:hypothetical protein n=1 Tax=Sphingomonas sp. Y38-1Y TaxID=3078265 RepID=UPI0028E9C4AC|nr:hypothetical protein [Sphingomonas sp. Y38-1Y]